MSPSAKMARGSIPLCTATRLAVIAAAAFALMSPGHLSAGVKMTADTGREVTADAQNARRQLPRLTITTSARQTRLSNALRLIILDNYRSPLARIHIEVIGAGVDRLDEPKGTAQLVADALLEGTASQTKMRLSKTIEDLASDFSVGINDAGNLTISGACLSEDAPAMLRLMADVIMHPALGQEALSSLRAGGIRRAQGSRGDMARQMENRLWSSVYTRDADMEMDETGAADLVSRATLLAFHRRHVSPANTVVIVGGDLPGGDWNALVADTMASWEPSSESRVAASDVSARRATDGRDVTTSIVDLPDARTTYLAIGAPVAPHEHADRVPLMIMNEILGGGSQARFMRRMRWEAAYSYGVGSQIKSAWPSLDLWFAAASTGADKVGDALAIMMKEIDRIRTEPLKEDELASAKFRYVVKQMSETSSPADLFGLYVRLWREGLPMDYLSTLSARVEAVTADDVRRVAAQYLASDRLKIVAVGDAARITKALSIYGKTAVYDASGQRTNITH